ncbi:hypothetical protein [Sediminispirochaeta bajacaliforniensis]|uniref:hypothetical protein n=1 Tax=Sediminispirochaeta bajacaliforniensis TaxID=148 RepID=UPI0003746854|nr:hypothetical protein [Sediminispirochaeta bajacaliforniensis]
MATKKINGIFGISILFCFCICGWGLYYHTARNLDANRENLRKQRATISRLESNNTELERINRERSSDITKLGGNIEQLNKYIEELERINRERNANIERLNGLVKNYERNQRKLAEIVQQVNTANSLNQDR